MKNNFFALGYIPNRLWGNILIAQILEKDDMDLYYVTGEILLKNENSLSYQKLSPMQKRAVNLIHEYNDNILHQLFSKKKNVKEFQTSVDQATIKDHIRPYIEKRLFELFQLASENDFKVFVKEKGKQNVFSDDFFIIHKNPAKPYFSFDRNEEDTEYRLSILHDEKPVVLIREKSEIICNDPAAVLLDKEVYFIENTIGRKLTAFFQKDSISVPKASEKKYYSTFVANTLKENDVVKISGFDIKDIVPQVSASVSLEFGISQNPVWVVSLKYNNYSIHPSSKLKRFVNFNDKNNNFSFDRFSRDYDWEEKIEVALGEIGLKSREGNVYTLRKWLSDDSQSQIYEAVKFTNDHYDFFLESGLEVSQKLDKSYYLKPVELKVVSEEKEDWFDLRAVIKFGEFTFPFTSLKKHILKGQRLFELPDGTFAVIPEEWFTNYKAVFEFGKVDGEAMRIHKQHFSQVDNELKKQHASTIGQLEKLNRLTELPEVIIPKGLTATMRDYQVEGFGWLCMLQESGFGGCLADDMGLGKTLQAIAVLLQNKELHVGSTKEDTPEPGQLSMFRPEQACFTSLIVVPSSLIQNWVNEIKRFAPSLKVMTHVGVGREKNSTEFKYADVIISSYHTVRQDIEFMRDHPFHYVILDESQMIKNPHSKLYRAMIELQASHKLVLTGTPIENSLTDLWSQINFVNEGLLGSLNFFKKQFVKNIEQKKSKKQEERLKQLINPFILRRTKEEVAKELPPVYEQYRFCNMTDEQKRLYEEEKSSVRNNLIENLEDTGLEKSTMMVLKALTRLRQLSNHPLMVEDDYEAGSGKYDEVFRNMESVVTENHKVLVFSSFVKHLKLYAKQLDENGWQYAMLTGSTRNRAAEVEKFQNDPDCKIFLISLKAGGVGLNLTAADYVFILDPWWNPAAEMQALNRAHRIGQDKNVFVYRFISNHTVEEKIIRLQERKKELANTFVTSNNPLRNMKKEDILDLFD
jgi:SNF2 family DNA or RNA helicase